ncbi:MAG: hypothetical protein AAF772_12720, partial [Acidobacteriota bacterium]
QERTRHAAMMRYRPGSFEGRLTFVRAADRGDDDPAHPERAWLDRARGGTAFQTVYGDPQSMFQPPHVQALAGCLRRALDAAER